MKTASEPFRFHARFVLSFAAGRAARSLGELRAGIAELPDDVLYQHTHRFLAEHEALVPEPSNDFSSWVTDGLADPTLGERLAGVDVLGFASLSDLRGEFLRILDEAIGRDPGWPAPAGREFHFLSVVRYSVPTGLEARTLAEFADAVGCAAPSCLYLHLYEAKLRGGGGVSDFSRWLEKEMDEPDLARTVGELDLYGWTLNDVRRRFLDLLASALTGKKHAPA